MKKKRIYWNQEYKDIVAKLEVLERRHNIENVFNDFCVITAIAISNAHPSCKEEFEKRETEYRKVKEKYTLEEFAVFSEVLAEIMCLIENNIHLGCCKDILGEIYMGMNFENQWMGQYFTPQNVAVMMAELTLGTDFLNKDGYKIFLEPTCGSGVLILAAASVYLKNGVDYAKKMLVTAIDADLICALMAYVQFSLYGIPAVVIHGNSLTGDEHSRWYTPKYHVAQKIYSSMGLRHPKSRYNESMQE